MKLRIFEKVDAINRYLKDLNELNIENIEILKNKEKYYASSMIVFSILNDFFVLGDEMIDELGLEIAQKYKDIFTILEKGNYISKEDLYFCKNLVYLRNNLAHEYGEIKLEDLFELVSNIYNVKKVIDKLIKEVKWHFNYS